MSRGHNRERQVKARLEGEIADERERAYGRHYRHLRRFGQTNSDLTVDDDLALRREAPVCPLCDIEMTDTPSLAHSKEMDHIITARNGGQHERANVRIICRACNRARRDHEHGIAGQIRAWRDAA